MDEKTSQRLNILSRHVIPTDAEHVTSLASTSSSPSLSHLAFNHTTATAAAKRAYASATGTPSSYAQVHGEVSAAPVQWRQIPSVSNDTLREVKYEKSVGEGIAKVSLFERICFFKITAVVDDLLAASLSSWECINYSTNVFQFRD